MVQATSDHIVRSFTEDLKRLDDCIAQMGGLAETVFAQSVAALEQRDAELAARVIERDSEIDELDRELESMALQVIARRQPMAQDLRQIFATLKISTDLERIGDLAKNIAKRAIAIADETHPTSLIGGMRAMADRAQHQLNDVLDAYAKREVRVAEAVWRRDAEIDTTYNSLYRDLLEQMMTDSDSVNICTHLMFGAKNIERIGDHTTNIAEIIFFLVEGTPLGDPRPKSDRTSGAVFNPGPQSMIILPASEPRDDR